MLTSSETLLAELLATDPESERLAILESFVDGSQVEQQDAFISFTRERWLKSMFADPKTAQTCSEVIETIASLSGLFRHRALALQIQGQIFSLVRGDFREGLRLQNDALGWAHYAEDEIRAAKINTTRSWTLAQLSQYEDAVQCAQAAMVVYETQQDWIELAKVKNNLALIYADQHQYELALAAFQEALQLNIAEDSASYFLTSGNLNKAWMLLELGRFEEARQLLEEVIVICKRDNEHNNLALAQENLGTVYFLTGDYMQALRYLSDANTYFQENANGYALECALDYADCLLLLHRYDAALEIANSVFDSADSASSTFCHAVITQVRALNGLTRYENALALLDTQQQKFPTTQLFWYMQAQLMRVNGYLNLNQTQQALENAADLQTLCAENNWDYWEQRVEILAIDCLLKTGQIQQAQAKLHELHTRSDILERPEMSFLVSSRLAQAAEQLNDLEGALAWLEACIRGLEDVQAKVMTEHIEGYVAAYDQVYARAVDIALQLERPLDAFFYAERAKSRSLLALLISQDSLKIDALSDADSQLIEEYNRLRAEWTIGNQRLQRLLHSSQGEAVHTETHVSQLRQTEKKLKQTWHDILLRDATYSKSAARLTNPLPKDPRPHLDSETALIEYYAVEGQLIAFIFTSDCLEVLTLNATSEHIAALMRAYELNLQAVAQDPNNSDYLIPNVKGVSGKLYEKLLLPIVANLQSNIDKLILVRHDVLHYVPFHALFDGAQYVLETFEVRYLPMADSLNYLQTTKDSTARVVIAGHTQDNLLPAVEEEVAAIAKLWPTAVRLENTRCKSLKLRAEAADAQLLHIATHAVFRQDEPVFSGIALEDGLLTALDIFAWRLQASLVTLSACETGRASIGGGDEILGLMRAFLNAGTASLVLSQWIVDDTATQLLMTHFYQNLQAGQPKAAALRNAQLHLRHNAKYSHPWFWAAFMLIGDGSSL